LYEDNNIKESIFHFAMHFIKIFEFSKFQLRILIS